MLKQMMLLMPMLMLTPNYEIIMKIESLAH